MISSNSIQNMMKYCNCCASESKETVAHGPNYDHNFGDHPLNIPSAYKSLPPCLTMLTIFLQRAICITKFCEALAPLWLHQVAMPRLIALSPRDQSCMEYQQVTEQTFVYLSVWYNLSPNLYQYCDPMDLVGDQKRTYGVCTACVKAKQAIVLCVRQGWSMRWWTSHFRVVSCMNKSCSTGYKGFSVWHHRFGEQCNFANRSSIRIGAQQFISVKACYLRRMHSVDFCSKRNYV